MKIFLRLSLVLMTIGVLFSSCSKEGEGDYGEKRSIVGLWILPQSDNSSFYYYEITSDGNMTYYEVDGYDDDDYDYNDNDKIYYRDGYIVVPKGCTFTPYFHGPYQFVDQKYFYFDGILFFTVDKWINANTAVVSSDIIIDGTIYRAKGIKNE